MARQSKNLPKFKTPSANQVRDVFEEALRDAELFDEPMYELSDKNLKNLNLALEILSTSFFGKEKYKTLEEKAAALFYFTIKDHIFPNGNKRTAVILTLLFLKTNGYWLNFTKDELYDLAIKVASKAA